MKNVQVIEPAEICCFSVHAVSDDDFALMFPVPGQDLEFVEDLAERLGEQVSGQLVMRATAKQIPKTEVRGIHGTLFIGFAKRKKHFPNKRENDLDVIPLGRPRQ